MAMSLSETELSSFDVLGIDMSFRPDRWLPVRRPSIYST